jgi:hypothetical protein
MLRHFPPRPCRVALTSLLALVACVSQPFAQARHQDKTFGAGSKEWGIHYAGYNIANLQKNGVADERGT